MNFDGEVIVIGLGAIGAATLYQLARRGSRVLGIDRFSPPHAQGSSHGESRITRLAVGEGDAYVPIVRRSHAIWRELEKATGAAIYADTGGLVLAPVRGSALSGGRTDFLRRTIAIAQRHHIAHEVLDADAITRRFPQFQLQGDELGYFEPEAGFLRPEAAIAAQLQQARVHGAQVNTGERVRVVTSNGRHLADRVVLAAGPWLPDFIAAPTRSTWAGSVAVYRQVMYWCDAGGAAPSFAAGRFPVFIWAYGDGDEDSFYGFPASAEHPMRIKVASAQRSVTTTADGVDREVSANEAAQMFRSRVAGRLRLHDERPVDARTCLYTVTPDRQFLIDELPDLPAVLVASACSGHGFKHSAGLGAALAERVLGLAPTLDLQPFRHARLAPTLAPSPAPVR
jgi:sarcosine oxidase